MSGHPEERAVVAEIQGLEGSFSFAERLLQGIWARGDFDRTRAVTADGRTVKIVRPGTWNRRGGPDFLEATLEIGGHRVQGDVELHLRAADWAAHGHRDDPNYSRVVLHVVLFPPQASAPMTSGAGETKIPVLALLPLLYRSLEEYAEEDAVERLADHPLAKAQETLLALSSDEQRVALEACAWQRWRQKIRFAEKRIERLGWREACHQTTLEILGYRFNRGPMLLLATENPLDRWPGAGAGENLEYLCATYAPRWNRQAVRPANHPKTRLRQYAAWTAAVPDWPDRLQRLTEKLSAQPMEAEGAGGQAKTAIVRQRLQLAKLVLQMRSEIGGNAVGGTRWLTLLADGFWPLAAARQGGDASPLRLYWYHGYMGDLPESIPRLIGALGLTDRRLSPLCHGLAQGLLGWIWREEERSHQTTACP